MTQPAINAFTAPGVIQWARHEHARVSRNTARNTKSIRITPPAGTIAERGARRALIESRKDVIDRFHRALNKR